METNPSFQLINYLNRGGAFGYYWLKLPPEQEGQETGPKRTIWYKVGDPSPWPEGSYDLYFGVHPSKHIPQRTSKKTGRQISSHLLRTNLADIAAINCLFAEFDAKHYRGGKDEAFEYIKSLGTPPSVLVDSGGGYHAYWLLVNPIKIPDQFTLNLLRSYQARWVELVDGDPDSKDLCRVLRVPGSYNFKYDPPREVSIVYADWDMPYELPELTKLLPPEPEPQPVKPLPMVPTNGSQRDPCANWLNKALTRSASAGRNNTGYWLAQQLVWDGIGETDQERVMLDYASRVRNQGDHEYTDEEALKSLESARKLPPRDPARGRNVTGQPAGRLAASQPKNGDKHELEPVSIGAGPVTKSNGNGHAVTDQVDAAPVLSPDERASIGNNGDGDRQASPVEAVASIDKSNGAAGTLIEPEKPPPPEEDQEESSTNKLLLSASHDHDGHAHCVMALYPNKFAYCDKWGWLFYNGKCWSMDGAEGAVNRAIIETLKARRIAAVRAEIEALVKVTRANSNNVNGVRDILKNYVEVFPDDFDNNNDLLNCDNGSLNLKTGELLPHHPSQRFTYCIPVDYDPAANCDFWVSFLKDAVGHEEIVDYLQVALGYSVTGHTYEEVMFYLYGPRRSGKGTFSETIINLLGKKPLAAEVDFGTFTADRLHDTQNFDLAPLKPCRFIAASESKKERPLNPAKIKALTGRNYVWCAFKHKDHFGYQPMYKIWLSSNWPVNLDVDDDAAWGRVRVVEFPNSHAGAEDKTLKIKMLTPEVQRGILRWIVDGARRWYDLWTSTAGLPLPKIIQEATEGQRDQQNNVKTFIAECCEVNEDAMTPTGDLYRAYKEWCEANGVPPKYHNKFTQALGSLGYKVVITTNPINKKTTRFINQLKILA